MRKINLLLLILLLIIFSCRDTKNIYGIETGEEREIMGILEADTDDPVDTDDPPNIEFDYEEFKVMRSAWEAKGIENYSFEYHKTGNPKVDYKIFVKNNAVDNIIVLNNSYPDFPVSTFDGLFSNIEQLYLNEEEMYNPDADIVIERIIIEYDSMYHFICRYKLQYRIKPGVYVSIDVPNFRITEFEIN